GEAGGTAREGRRRAGGARVGGDGGGQRGRGDGRRDLSSSGGGSRRRLRSGRVAAALRRARAGPGRGRPALRPLGRAREQARLTTGHCAPTASIWRSSSSLRSKVELARSSCMCRGSVVPVSGSIPTCWAKRKTS